MQLILKIPGGMTNRTDTDQTALIWICTVCICHFVRNKMYEFVQSFRTFTVNFIPSVFYADVGLTVEA